MRLWKRVGVRHDADDGEVASKLKLFNHVYEVVRRVGSNYVIRDIQTGRELPKPVNVTQIARMRSAVAESVEPEVDVSLPSEQVWDKVSVATFVVFWDKEYPRSYLRVAEVLEFDSAERSLWGWYHIHKGRAAAGEYNQERPLAERRLIPEWKHKRTQQGGVPRPGQEAQFQKIFCEFKEHEIDLIAAGFHLQSDGKVPKPVCDRADTWLRRACRAEPRAVIAISSPTESERKRVAAL